MLRPEEFEEVKQDLDSTRQTLLDDFYFFVRYSFEMMTGRSLIIPNPVSRKNHVLLVAKGFERAIRGEALQQYIGIPPRHGKTLLADNAIAWCYAHEPAANWIYGSYGKSLATEQTEYIRSILESRWYQEFFDVRINKTARKKDHFKTMQGGQTIAIGADGAGLGFGAGIKQTPFGGGILLDDMLKTEEAHSKAKTERFARTYSQNIVNRRNDPNLTPIVMICQRLSQNDPPAKLMGEYGNDPIDVYSGEWKKNAIVIPALDACGNALWPEMQSKEYLEELKRIDEFTFYSIFQQQPISSANKIFKTEFIKILKEEPEFLVTFIVGDTAETEDSINDATVFHFFGLYEIEIGGEKTGMLGLHSIMCWEIRVEPEFLEEEFESFYMQCLRHCSRHKKEKPSQSHIEKKSTGVTLVSVMRNKPGLSVIDIKRPSGSGSKITRFLKAAPFIAKGQFSICRDAPHLERLKKHLDEITADGAYKHDDIADTVADGIRLGLDEKTIYNIKSVSNQSNAVNHIASINRNRRIKTSRG